MGEQDVDGDIAAGIEIYGGDMALSMGDLDDPAIDDRYLAVRQIGLDIGRNVVNIGEDGQLVCPRHIRGLLKLEMPDPRENRALLREAVRVFMAAYGA